MEERCGQHIFSNACFAPTRKSRFSVVMLKGGKGEVAGMQFAKVVVLLRLRCVKGGKEKEVAIVHHMEETAPLNAVEINPCCICVR